MITQWGGALDSSAILPEYPRPQFQRKQFEILNGTWEYAVTGVSAQIPPDRFDGPILVPFSPESELSGVQRALKPTEALWYRRYLEAPLGFDANAEDLLLHFGAVDQRCTVTLNGREVGAHAGDELAAGQAPVPRGEHGLQDREHGRGLGCREQTPRGGAAQLLIVLLARGDGVALGAKRVEPI